MIGIFLLPFPFRGVQAPYLWVFYKFLSEIKEKTFFLISPDYLKEPDFFIKQNRWETHERSLTLNEYNLPSSNDFKKHIFKFLDDDIFQKLIRETNYNLNEAFRIFLTEENDLLKEAFEKIIPSFINGKENTKIEAFLTWCNCPSLKVVLNKYGIKLIHLEVGPLRPPIYKYMAYFDFSGVNGNTEAESRYISSSYRLNFTTDKLRKFFKSSFEEKIVAVDNNKLGVVLQIENDTNQIAWSNSFNNQSMLDYVSFFFNKKDILIRSHPGSLFDVKIKRDSSSSIEDLLSKCDQIITINSSVGLEALLYDKETIVLGESSYKFITKNKKSLIEKLNFYMLSYLVPYKLIFDYKYIRFRLSMPSEEEIIFYHIYGECKINNNIETIIDKDLLIKENENHIKDLERTQSHLIQERDQLHNHVADLERTQSHLIQERDQLHNHVADLERTQSHLIQERDQLHNHVADLKRTQSHLIQERDQLHNHVADLERTQSHLNYDIQLLINSLSWKITYPLRYFKKVIFYIKRNSLKMIFLKIIQIVKQFFTNTKDVIRPGIPDPVLCTLDGISVKDYVPLLDAEPLKNKPVRLIAFYLPQFHEIPENNEWWGKGFTEWTNVKPAKPQFEGHYQPHIPGELGYYNLLDPKIQKRQVELAQLYGIEGFCFYFYWFAGKRLLEQPILNYLENKDLNLPFCLCWANENWSRRWDGLDQDILIAQDHSSEDDLEFIKYISKYLLDDRYIKIDGKPVLLIYRPELFPNIISSVSIWRKYCKENGFGDLYLIYPQSFSSVPPYKYGFDAATEFAPINMNLNNVTKKYINNRSDFGCNLYDWGDLLKKTNLKTDYVLFKSVNPGWDNTPRKKNKSSILTGCYPYKYQQLLDNQIKWTVKNKKKKDEDLIFINAWNEWAEGAHLEPDIKYGYAYLESTRIALINNSLKVNSLNKIAIVFHIFYEDILFEVLDLMNKHEVNCKIFITCRKEIEKSLVKILENSNFNYEILICQNRGRDILPFLKIMPYLIKEEYTFFLKIHSKKSKHREDGDNWRNVLYDNLFSNFNNSKILLEKNNNIGLISPTGFNIEISNYFGSNASNIIFLSRRLGLSEETILRKKFIAGSMFFGRVDALKLLLSLAISDEDFEEESGQIDGTMAHAIERMFTIASESAGYKTVEIDALNSDNVKS